MINLLHNNIELFDKNEQELINKLKKLKITV